MNGKDKEKKQSQREKEFRTKSANILTKNMRALITSLQISLDTLMQKRAYVLKKI
jgi:hypothetical protein